MMLLNNFTAAMICNLYAGNDIRGIKKKTLRSMGRTRNKQRLHVKPGHNGMYRSQAKWNDGCRSSGVRVQRPFNKCWEYRKDIAEMRWIANIQRFITYYRRCVQGWQICRGDT